MRNPLKSNLLSRTYKKLRQNSQTTVAVVAPSAIVFVFCLATIGSATALAQDTHFVLDRDGRTIVLEPYAPNILRITFSKDKASAAAAAGYGLVGTPSMAGWTHQRDADGNDVFPSPRLVVDVSPDLIPPSRLPHPMPLDELNQSLRDHYFGGGSGNRRNDDTVSMKTASGKALLTMRNWSMVPNRSERKRRTQVS
jgi:alpha-D-xyloside xylohydrolase